jgi:hypothetical protein
LQTESFTMDVVDSYGGHLTGTRYPSGDAKLGSGAKCRVAIAVDVRGTDREAEVAATSRWLSPDAMLDQAPDVCEQERIDVLDRIAQLLAPPQPQ